MKTSIFLVPFLFIQISFSQTGTWNSSSTNYATSYNFDANGNISSINRNAYGSDNAMDKLDYYYNTDKNQLNYVTDEENVKFTTDLNTQTSNNYEYDKLGRLIKDVANGINKIEYTIFNKPYKIYKNNGDVIQFMYDASSNKVAQKITSITAEKSITYYTLTNTAQINGVYCSDGSNITLAESHISDLVTLTRNENIKTPRISSKVYTRLIHYKNYPLHDHLGSVRVVLSDKKESETEVSIIEESTYYPYGMQVPGMSYQTENSRFGFQGKEVLTAMTAAGGSHLDFGARINDVRIAQWTSVDPLESKYPSLSPYNSMNNNPINFIDPDGREPIITINEETNIVTVSLTVYLSGPGATETYREKIQNKIEKDWCFDKDGNPHKLLLPTTNDDFSGMHDEEYQVVFDVAFELGNDPAEKDPYRFSAIDRMFDGYAFVYIAAKPRDFKKAPLILNVDPDFWKTNHDRSFVTDVGGTRGVWEGYKNNFSDAMKVASHEFGHLIGIDDHYNDILVGQTIVSKPQIGYDNNIMGDTYYGKVEIKNIKEMFEHARKIHNLKYEVGHPRKIEWENE